MNDWLLIVSTLALIVTVVAFAAFVGFVVLVAR